MTSQIGKKGLHLAKAALGVAVIGLISKVLGFVREVTLARYFGASAATDAYLVAAGIPSLLVGAFINAINVTFIPIFAEYDSKHGEGVAFRLVNNTLNLLLLVSLTLGGVGYYLAPWIVKVLAPGFQGTQAALAVQLTRIVFPVVFAMAMNGLATSVLQSRQRFWVPAANGLAYNLVMITAIVISANYFGITGVAVGTVLAILGQTVFMLPSLYRLGYRYQPILDFREAGLRKIGVLLLPVLIGVTAGQLNTVVDRWLASTLTEGSISALSYAFRLLSLPLGLTITGITSVTYPLFSKMAAADQYEKLGQDYLKTVNVLILLMVPLTAGIIALREPFVRAVYQRGAFDAADTQGTAVALLFYAIGLLAYAMNGLTSKVFYAVQDTRTPMLINILMVGVNIVLNLILIKPMKHGGLALATALANYVGIMVFMLLFRRRYRLEGVKRVLVVAGVAGIASLLMGWGVNWLYYQVPLTWSGGSFIQQSTVLLGMIGIGAALYLILVKVSRLPEGSLLFEIVSRILRKTKTTSS